MLGSRVRVHMHARTCGYDAHMMGVTHRATGLCAGAGVAWGARELVLPAPAPVWASVVGVLTCVLLTSLAGRASMWPDLDHHNSTATNSMGLISGWIHEMVHAASCNVFDVSATEADVREEDFRGHRGLTHFGITALVVGALAGAATFFLAERQPVLVLGIIAGVLIGQAATWLWADVAGSVLGTVTAGLVWLAVPVHPVAALAVVTGLFSWLLMTEVAGHRTAFLLGTGAGATVFWLIPVPVIDWTVVGDVTAPGVGLGVGLAIATGMLAHSIGDAATKTGVPLLWPIKINGRRFHPIHIRSKGHRLHTGESHWEELKLRGWSWVLLGVAVVGWWPGLWPLLWDLIPWPWLTG